MKIEKHMVAELRGAHGFLAGIYAKCFAVWLSQFSGIFFSALGDIQFLLLLHQ